MNKKGFLFFLLISIIWFTGCLPKPLFNSPTSTVLLSEQGNLMGAKIAKDGQWRFPSSKSVPLKFKQAIVEYEDQQFYRHLGINPIAIYQAIKANYEAGKVVRGGSTITQQTIRLARKNPKRTYGEKLYELLLALRLELGFSKDKILTLYASNAPFGGNVVGIDAASWRYFGRSAEQLSWAESATLAVLPNAPGLIHPGRNREQLKQKRDLLLSNLYQKGKIDELTYENAIQEPLPAAPLDLPQMATHLLEKTNIDSPGVVMHSSINESWQESSIKIVERHHNLLKQNGIHNIGAIIIDVKTKKVKTYVGNTKTKSSHQDQVDMVQAARSTGSLLKPFLYAANLDEARFLPNSLLVDVPTYYNNYSPKNFTEEYAGVVPASQALATSLNVPAVRQLHDYGIPKFHAILQDMELEDIKYKASHYGLSLILGGAESSLWDLSRAYAGMASTLNLYNETDGNYYKNQFSQLSYNIDEEEKLVKSSQYSIYSAASIWHTLNALVEAQRPGEDKAWEYFSESQKIAWKTGTSYGNKDAWAIGVNPDYVVGVWVGNADGEGRTGNTGLATAAPILFDLIDILPASNWFQAPLKELYTTSVCSQSGFLPNKYCELKDTIMIGEKGLGSQVCPYHQQYTIDRNGEYRVHRNCEDASNIIQKTYFVLPPKQEIYYIRSNASYKKLPPYKPGCKAEHDADFSILYPPHNATLSVPVNLSGQKEKIIAKVAHKNPDQTLFWYLDETYIGKTTNIHEMELAPSKGNHLLGIVNETGNQIYRNFTVK